jgi:hypothetical protein
MSGPQPGDLLPSNSHVQTVLRGQYTDSHESESDSLHDCQASIVMLLIHAWNPTFVLLEKATSEAKHLF